MEQQFTQLGIGQAFITVLNEKGIPTETVVTHLAPPSSRMSPLSQEEYQAQLDQSSIYRKYQEAIDPRSAFEILNERMQTIRQGQEGGTPASTPRSPARTSREEKSTFEQMMASPVAKQVGRELVRGVFGMLFGTTARRTYRRR